MKHKTNVGPGLIVALGAPGDAVGKMGIGDGRSEMGDRRAGEKSEPRDLGSYDDATMDTVPLDMLSMPDDQEQMQPPEVGDVVNYQVTGKVVAIEGDYAKVQRQSINGQELQDPSSQGSDAASEDANGDEDGDDASSLRNDAAGIGMLS